jgi:demethylmenaquinone methyltransferase/2-methoxy-6-polyprenyl-1,4-benzoquinol methylase
MSTTIETEPQPQASSVDKSASKVRQMFGEIAPRYDFLNHLLSLNVDRYWRWRTVRLLKPQGKSPILDVCTGTGDLALALFRGSTKQGGKHSDVVGADFCRPMLEIAEQKAEKASATQHVQFVEADTMHLPFDTDQFQIVSVAFGLRNVADTDAGLREMARVCAPGGTVAVLEFSMPQWQPMKAIYGWYFRHVLPRIGRLFAKDKNDAYNYLPTSVGQFPQDEVLAAMMRDAGLSQVAYRPFTFGIATLYLGTK